MTLGSFIRSMMSVGAINLVDRIVGIVIGICLARLLGVQSYGIYAFAMAFMGMLMIPARWGQPELLLRETAIAQVDAHAFEPRAFARSSCLFVIAVCAVAALLSWPVIAYRYAGDAAMRHALYAMILVLPAYVLLDLACYGLRGVRKVVSAAWLLTPIPNALVMVGLGLFFLIDRLALDPTNALLLRCAALGLAALPAWLLLFRTMPPASADAPRLSFRQLFRMGVPFMLLTASSVLMSRTDIFILGLFHQPVDVGLYNVAFQAATLVDLGLQVSNFITTQEFARYHASGQREALQTFAIHSARITLAIGIGIFAFLALFGRYLLELLFGHEYRSAFAIMIVLALGKCVALLFGEPGFILNMSGNERTTVRIFGATALSNVALCLIAIPIGGPIGAAWASGLSLMVWRLLAWHAVRRKVGISCAVF
jgi:O-antigen/teichoic acid export membrane protein